MYGYINTGFPITIKQVVSGTGQFNGTEQGRAALTITATSPTANNTVYIAAKQYGTLSNSITVQLVDRGSGITVTGTTVSISGSAVSVVLRRSSGAVLATAKEVSDAINSYAGLPLPISAGYSGTGLDLVNGTTATALTGGLDPTIDVVKPALFTWTYATNANGGFFFFENYREPLSIRLLSAAFTGVTGTNTVTFSRVDLNSRNKPISGTDIPIFTYTNITSSNPSITVSDPRTIIQPGHGLLVTTSTALVGTVQVDIQKMTGFPTL